MTNALHLECVEKIVSAIYPSGNLLSSFMFGKPGAPHWDLRSSTEIFTRGREYMDAVLYVRRHGAPYLRLISIGDLRSMMTKFVTANFWHIGGNNFPPLFSGSYGAAMSLANKQSLADSLAASPMFSPVPRVSLYPLVTLKIVDTFEADSFFLTSAEKLSHSQLNIDARGMALDATRFPPFLNWEGIRRPVMSWLGVRSPLPQISQKVAASVLGAIALTQLPRYRFLFSGRKIFGGSCTLDKDITVVPSGEGHTPPLMYDILITSSDHAWLTELDSLLTATDRPTRSKLRALEYFYRAWFLDPHERFAPLCMALDALLGVEHGHTAAAVKFVKATVDPSIDEERLRLLMRVRGAVIHGAAPDVFDSENYEAYWLTYRADPIRDLELIVGKCLRTALFSDRLKHHADPHAEKIAVLQASGRIPTVMEPDAIISPEL